MSPKQAKFSVIEHFQSGHRLSYVRDIAKAAHAAGFDVSWITVASAIRSRPYIVQLAGQVESFLHVRIVGGGPRIAKRRTLSLLLAEHTQGDRICIPDGDAWLCSLVLCTGRLRAYRGTVQVVVMRPFRGAGIRGWFAHLVKGLLIQIIRRLARSVSVAALVPPGMTSEGLLQTGKMVADSPLNTVVLGSRADARSHHGIPLSSLVAGIVGHVEERKSPLLAAEALSLFSTSTEQECILLLAGIIDSQVVARIKEVADGVEVRIIGGYLDEDGYAAAIRSCDVVLALHVNEGSSGVVAEASNFGVPVVAAGSRSIRSQVREADAGAVVEYTPAAVADGIRRTISHRSASSAGSRGTQNPSNRLTIIEFAVD